MTDVTETVADTTEAELDALLDAAVAAAPVLAATRPSVRAGWLRAVADALDADAERLIPLAAEESHLPVPRLTGELKRTTFQLRLFADVLDEGAYLQVTIDHADPTWGMGPRPDLRRMLRPLGPVAIWAASNFPFAFSVAGGDTASALAAGTPVLLKAHPGHPRLSVATGDVVVRALREAGAPDGTFALVTGVEIGRALITDPRIAAGAVHRIPEGRQGAVRPRLVAADADPLLRRARQREPGGRHAVGRGGEGGGGRDRLRGLDDARRRPVLHEAGAAVRAGRLRAAGARGDAGSPRSPARRC